MLAFITVKTKPQFTVDKLMLYIINFGTAKGSFYEKQNSLSKISKENLD